MDIGFNSNIYLSHVITKPIVQFKHLLHKVITKPIVQFKHLVHKVIIRITEVGTSVNILGVSSIETEFYSKLYS